MRILLYCFLAILWPGVNSSAQTKSPSIKPLHVGDTIPADLELENVLNYPASKIQLKALKGKLVIFDFFATWCAPCVQLLPKLEKLQNQFKLQIQIIVVTPESEEKTKKFLQSTMGKNTNLPFVSADQVLKHYFPHRLIPHEVIIGPGGKVAAITHHDFISAEAISSILSGKAINLPVKQDLIEFDANKAFYAAFAEGLIKPSFSSIITKHIPGVGSGYRKQFLQDSSAIRISFFNLPIISLYEQATGLETKNRLVLQTADSARYFKFDLPAAIWVPENTYSYELVAPVFFTDKQKKQAMIATLNNYFSITGRLEKRKINCWAIVSNGNTCQIKSKGGKALSNLSNKQGSVKQIVNKPIAALVNFLNNKRGAEIVLDETGFAGKVDLTFPIPDLFDLKALKKVLNNYNLDLLKVVREVELLVLSD